MPTNTEFPLGLQQQVNQPLQTAQPQFGNIGLQGSAAGAPPPPPPNDPWYRRLLGYLGGAAKKGGEFAFGTPGGFQQVPMYSPTQMQAFNGILGGGINSLMNPYEGFQGLEDYAHQQFRERIVPEIFHQFNAGTGGARLTSSPFAQQLGASGSGLAAMLAAHRAQYGMQNRELGLRQAALGLTPQFQNIMVEPQTGLVQQLAPLAAQAGLMYATGGLSGAPAAANLIGQGIQAFRR